MSKHEKRVCDVLEDMRMRLSSGNGTPVRSIRITLEEFAIICSGFSNWTGRPARPAPSVTPEMWEGIEQAKALARRVQKNREARIEKLGRLADLPPLDEDKYVDFPPLF